MNIAKSQIGLYFLIIGAIMLAIFFVSDQSQSPQFLLFFGGVLVVGFGISLIWRDRKPPPSESARFRTYRRMQQRSREQREKKKSQKK
jgi:hypothetical protein